MFQGCFTKHGCNFDDISKIGYSKTKVFWNKCYGAIKFHVTEVIL